MVGSVTGLLEQLPLGGRQPLLAVRAGVVADQARRQFDDVRIERMPVLFDERHLPLARNGHDDHGALAIRAFHPFPAAALDQPNVFSFRQDLALIFFMHGKVEFLKCECEPGGFIPSVDVAQLFCILQTIPPVQPWG